jgi:NAD(P)-dependent dehydrogenase (short-subunit alcohol dehydrogenase family)
MFTLNGRTALVTGGSRGLGYAMAEAIGRAGARLVITARKPDELASAQEQLQSHGIDVVTEVHDVADVETTPKLIERIRSAVGGIDVLINNAGATWGAPALDYPPHAWRKVCSVNLDGTWELTRSIARQFMVPQSRGVIVIVASVAGLRAGDADDVPTIAYNATKAAQIAMARSLAAEWGRHGIRVNALLPGWFYSRMTANTLERRGQAYAARTPLGRIGEPSADIGGPIVFLASDASRYVTATTLIVDGGLSAV